MTNKVRKGGKIQARTMIYLRQRSNLTALCDGRWDVSGITSYLYCILILYPEYKKGTFVFDLTQGDTTINTLLILFPRLRTIIHLSTKSPRRCILAASMSNKRAKGSRKQQEGLQERLIVDPYETIATPVSVCNFEGSSSPLHDTF